MITIEEDIFCRWAKNLLLGKTCRECVHFSVNYCLADSQMCWTDKDTLVCIYFNVSVRNV